MDPQGLAQLPDGEEVLGRAWGGGAEARWKVKQQVSVISQCHHWQCQETCFGDRNEIGKRSHEITCVFL